MIDGDGSLSFRSSEVLSKHSPIAPGLNRIGHLFVWFRELASLSEPQPFRLSCIK